MKKKMMEYIESFAFFRETFMRLTGIGEYETIMEHYLNFEAEVCACEMCREDEGCIHIDTPAEDDLPDWD